MLKVVLLVYFGIGLVYTAVWWTIVLNFPKTRLAIRWKRTNQSMRQRLESSEASASYNTTLVIGSIFASVMGAVLWPITIVMDIFYIKGVKRDA